MTDAVPLIRSRSRHLLQIVMVMVVASSGLVALTVRAARASAPAVVGYATNFDVPNGTDKECEGFEVEIEDITDTQITYTWPGSPGYPNPYGTSHTFTNTTFSDGHPGVVVRFTAAYANGAWSAKTPIGQVNHFGIHVTGTPGMQRYSWLCDLGGSAAGSTGTLTPYGGTTQGNFYPTPSVPAVVPNVVATPTGEQVQTVIAPAVPPQPAEARFQDAVWVLKYQASSPNAVDVNQLLITDPEVQNAIANSQISSIAELFQPDPGTNQGLEQEPPDPIDAGDRSSLTVTETYRYTGPVDPVDNSITCNETPNDPNNCSNFVGPMIARQMVAANLQAALNRSTLDVNVLTGPSASDVGGSVASSATANANPGEIDCGASCFTSVDTGTAVALAATANPGYHFDHWTGGCSGPNASCSVPVSGITTVNAVFAPDAPTLYVQDASTYEGKAGTTHTMKLNVSLTRASVGTTAVSYSTTDGTATAGSDYTAKSGTLKIGAGKSAGVITVPVTGDNAIEGDEDFGLVINSVSGGYDIGTAQATGTILDDDTDNPPVVSVGDATIVEGNSGTANAVFTVTMSAPRTTKTPVSYETANGSAIAGSDYTAKTGTVTIAAGAVMAKILVPVKGDTTPAGTKTFAVKVTGTGSSGVSTDRDNATGRILDDDTTPLSGASIGDATVIEGDTGQKVVTLAVTLSAPRSTTTAVRYHTLDGTATADGDYVGKTGVVNILAGKVSGTITIMVNGDTSIENTEMFSVIVDSATGLALARPTGTVTVFNDY